MFIKIALKSNINWFQVGNSSFSSFRGLSSPSFASPSAEFFDCFVGVWSSVTCEIVNSSQIVWNSIRGSGGFACLMSLSEGIFLLEEENGTPIILLTCIGIPRRLLWANGWVCCRYLAFGCPKIHAVVGRSWNNACFSSSALNKFLLYGKSLNIEDEDDDRSCGGNYLRYLRIFHSSRSILIIVIDKWGKDDTDFVSCPHNNRVSILRNGSQEEEILWKWEGGGIWLIIWSQ